MARSDQPMDTDRFLSFARYNLCIIRLDIFFYGQKHKIMIENLILDDPEPRTNVVFRIQKLYCQWLTYVLPGLMKLFEEIFCIES